MYVSSVQHYSLSSLASVIGSSLRSSPSFSNSYMSGTEENPTLSHGHRQASVPTAGKEQSALHTTSSLLPGKTDFSSSSPPPSPQPPKLPPPPSLHRLQFYLVPHLCFPAFLWLAPFSLPWFRRDVMRTLYFCCLVIFLHCLSVSWGVFFWRLRTYVILFSFLIKTKLSLFNKAQTIHKQAADNLWGVFPFSKWFYIYVSNIIKWIRNGEQ